MIIAGTPGHVRWPVLGGFRVRKLLIAGAACMVAELMGVATNAQSVYAPGTMGDAGQPATPKPGDLMVNMGMGVTTYVNGSWKTGQTHGTGTGSKQQPTVITGYGRSLHR